VTELGMAAVMAAAGLAMVGKVVPVRMDLALYADGAIYTAMVEHPGSPVGGHFHRYLAPLIVRWLPWDLDTGFRVVTLGSSLVASLLCYGIGRALGLSATQALPLVPMYLLTWPTVANVLQYRLVDPLAWVFVAGALLLLLRERTAAACLVAGAGALAKETTLLALPLAAWIDRRTAQRRRVGRLVGILALGLLPYAMVRMAVPGEAGAGTSIEATLAYLLDRWSVQWREVGPFLTAFYTFAPFGALWLLLPLGLRDAAARPREVLVGWLLLTAPTVLNGSPERMLEVQAPAVLALAALALTSVPLAVVYLIVVANGLFILRIAATAMPWGIAWGGLLVALLGVGWVWWTAPRRVASAADGA
jgi:hypothetical protein